MENAHQAFKGTDVFKSVSLDMVTSGAKGKSREFRFLEEGENGSTSRQPVCMTCDDCFVNSLRENHNGIIVVEGMRKVVQDLRRTDI